MPHVACSHEHASLLPSLHVPDAFPAGFRGTEQELKVAHAVLWTCQDLRQTRMHASSKSDSVAVEVNITEFGNIYHTKIYVDEFSGVCLLANGVVGNSS